MAKQATMVDYREAIERIVSEARALSEPEQVAALEQAVALADSHNDVELAYNVRLELMNAALNCGKADTLLVAFSWCAAMADREPERFDPQRVLWWNRWAVIYAPTFPTIAAERIWAAVADMETRYRKAGASLRTVYWATWKVAFEMGDRPKAAQMYRAMKRIRFDWLGPDPDTEAVMYLEYWMAFGQHKRVTTQAPIILRQQSGDFYALQIQSWLMTAYLHLGQLEQAMTCHLQSYRPMLKQASVVIQASRHVAFLGVTANFPRAFRLLERYIGYCVTSDPQDQFEMYCAADLLLRCAAKLGKPTVRLRLPTAAPGYVACGQYDSLTLADAFRAACLTHAHRFDARNGNDFYSKIHARWLKLVRRARSFPIPSS